jgi:hypothetical protein
VVKNNQQLTKRTNKLSVRGRREIKERKKVREHTNLTHAKEGGNTQYITIERNWSSYTLGRDLRRGVGKEGGRDFPSLS